MKHSHKKIIALVSRDIIPYAIDHGIGIMQSAILGKKEAVAVQQIQALGNLSKKVGKTKGSGKAVSSNIEDLSLNKEELGRRTWDKMHNNAAALPKDATPDQVKEVMKKNHKIIDDYPCLDCNENAKKNLKVFEKKYGKKFTDAVTRTEAIMNTFNFHNIVNEDLEKNLFSEDSLKANYDL